jgi:hypothetical protein
LGVGISRNGDLPGTFSVKLSGMDMGAGPDLGIGLYAH